MGFRWSFTNVAFLGFLFFHGSCSSKEAPNYTFAKDATLAPAVVHYDYIIVGGGTSGCALAATLAQSSSVLLLERGGLPYGNPTITKVGSFLSTLANSSSPTSPSQTFISEDGVISSRARVLGGGSALNAGFYTRASSEYVGLVGWDPILVEESYEWIEKKLVFRPPVLQWQSAVRDGLLEVGVLPSNGYTFEHIYGTKVGGSIFDENGDRHTAADLLEYADPTKISVYLFATVHRILFVTQGNQKRRANGVVFKDSNGEKHTAFLKVGQSNEVILTAGALGSPQLLMLSGIGPSEHLLAHGIKVLLDQPMVGQAMSDNPMNLILIPSPEPVETSLIQVVGITQFGSFIETASWSNFVDTLAQAISVASQGLPAQKLEAISKAIETISSTLNGSLAAGLILEKIIGPVSTGHLELLTKDPNHNPSVTFNYFKDPQDLQRCVQGMTTIINVIESKSFSKFRALPVQALIDLVVSLPLNLRPRHLSASFSLEQFCIDTVLSIWHYHGGCQVGKVVDREYKVVGVDALRVIDGSTFIDSPGTNPQATVMMLGRYMGQRILQERFPHGRK